MMCWAKVVFPDDSGPKISVMQPHLHDGAFTEPFFYLPDGQFQRFFAFCGHISPYPDNSTTVSSTQDRLTVYYRR
jgi:hypothetical protein